MAADNSRFLGLTFIPAAFLLLLSICWPGFATAYDPKGVKLSFQKVADGLVNRCWSRMRAIVAYSSSRRSAVSGS